MRGDPPVAVPEVLGRGGRLAAKVARQLVQEGVASPSPQQPLGRASVCLVTPLADLLRQQVGQGPRRGRREFSDPVGLEGQQERLPGRRVFPSAQHVEHLLRGDAEIPHLQDHHRPDRRVGGDRQEGLDVPRTTETKQRDGGIPRPSPEVKSVVAGGRPLPSAQCLPGGLHDGLAVPRGGREQHRELTGVRLEEQLGEQGGVRAAGEHEGRVHALGGGRGRVEEPLAEMRRQGGGHGEEEVDPGAELERLHDQQLIRDGTREGAPPIAARVGDREQRPDAEPRGRGRRLSIRRGPELVPQRRGVRGQAVADRGELAGIGRRRELDQSRRGDAGAGGERITRPETLLARTIGIVGHGLQSPDDQR